MFSFPVPVLLGYLLGVVQGLCDADPRASVVGDVVVRYGFDAVVAANPNFGWVSRSAV